MKHESADRLDACLQGAQDGATPAGAESLGPLLAVAGRLRRLNAYRLPEARRQRAKAALRGAWVAQSAAGKAQGWRGWQVFTPAVGRMSRIPAALLLAFILLIPLTFTALAASAPGGIGYPARVALERLPALVQSQARPRAAAELAIADRRMADLDAHMQRTGRLAPAAIEALLKGDAAAAAAALTLDEAGQQQVAARITAHAARLARLAGSTGDPAAQAALQRASQQAAQLATGLGESDPGPAQPEAPQTPEPTATPLPALSPEQPTRAQPSTTPSPTQLPGPTHTLPPGPRATELAHTATPPAAPTGTQQAPGSGPGGPTPGRRATELAQTATPPPGPTWTPPAPGQGPNAPTPGRRATELAQTAVPPAAPTSAPQGPAQGANTPGPGRRATELAQTATPDTTPDGQPAHNAGTSLPATPAPGRRAAELTQTAAPPAEPTITNTPAPEAAP